MSADLPPLEILPEDREAAALALGYRDYDDASDYRLSGRQDRAVADMVEAFARHRTTSLARMVQQHSKPPVDEAVLRKRPCLNCDREGTELCDACEQRFVGQIGAPREDFLDQLRRVNGDRSIAWAGSDEPDPLYQANEFGGEAGEILNVVKKLIRESRGWRGSRATVDDLADEIADGIICLDSLARSYGIDLREAVARKFNATSDKQGFPHRLANARSEPRS